MFKTISLIIPTYKQEKTIASNIKRVDSVLSVLSYNYEIIIVVDGFLDKTYENAKKMENENVRVYGYKVNHGKGYAVKYGVEKAKGDVIGFMDAGMDLNPVGVSLLLDLMSFHNSDIVIGSKLHPESKVSYPFGRRILSWGYRTLTELLFGLTVKDTQVGLKFFKRKVAKSVFPKILVKKFAFDIEVLVVAKKLGYNKILEGPVELDFSGASSITSSNFWRVVFYMLWDTLAVFYRLRIVNYYDRNEKDN